MDVIFGAREDVIFMVTAEWKKSVSHKRRINGSGCFFVEKRLYIEHKLKKTKKKKPQ